MGIGITPWVTQTNPIKDGEDVKAAIANRHALQLQQRTQNLKDRLDQLNAGQALIARNVPVSAGTKTGHAVYWDATTLQYKPAYAGVVFDNTLGGYITGPSSYVMGMCVMKYGATRADIALIGLIDTMDFTNGIGTPGNTPAEAGAYFLTANPGTAGMYTKTVPPLGIFVCFLRGDGSAHINPTQHELLESHVHYAVDLVSKPAGVIMCPDPLSPYSFISEDPAEAGWLPANNAVFHGFAPVGAVFGYNIAADPAVSRIWPPFPPEAVYLEKNGIGVGSDFFRADVHGLWWFKNCYAKAPWAIEPRPCGVVPPLNSSSSSVPFPVCEILPTLEQLGFVRTDPEKSAMRLYFTKLIAKSNAAAVTSLNPALNSPIGVVGCDGQPASVGDLFLTLDLGAHITEGDPSYFGLKGVTGFQFTRGPIVTGLIPGTNVSISIPNAARGKVVDGAYRGELVINAIDSSSLGREGSMDLVALNGAREESTDDVFYLSLPTGLETSMRLRIALPFNGLPTPNPKMTLWFWLLAGINGAVLPKLKLSYRRIARPSPLVPPPYDRLPLPTTDTNIADLDPTPWGGLVANNYIEIMSEAFSVAAGDEVFATILREGDTDLYAGNVGIVRMGFRVDPS